MNDYAERLEREYDKVVAERDRLRTEIKEERDINLAAGCPDFGVHHGCYLVVAERDRLRERYAAAWALEVQQTAVVEAAREWAASILAWRATVGSRDDASRRRDSAFTVLLEAVTQLDASPEATNG
jgi:hypothetical protein